MDERTWVNYYYTPDFSSQGIKKRVDRRPWSWGRGPWVGKTVHGNARGGTQELNKGTRVRKNEKNGSGRDERWIWVHLLSFSRLDPFGCCFCDLILVSVSLTHFPFPLTIPLTCALLTLWHLEGPLNANHLYKYCKLQAKRICTRKDSKFIPIC
jgi:hypothetical protein